MIISNKNNVYTVVFCMKSIVTDDLEVLAMKLENVDLLLKELRDTLYTVEDEQMEQLAKMIIDSPHVYVSGVGRSGLAARAFAMRLVHLGLAAYVVGEIATVSIQKGDLLIICSGSGETGSQVVMAQKAHKLGARIAIVTIQPGSSIGGISELEVFIKAPTPKLAANGMQSFQPMGSLFEQCTLLALDLLVVKLMRIMGVDETQMFARHANLE